MDDATNQAAMMQEAQDKISSLESELRLATSLLQSREAIHADELRKVEIDNAKTIAERRLAVKRLESVETIEEAVRDLYSSMRERIGYSGAPTAEQASQEKDELKETPILVILGHLHAICKSLYLFKHEAEADMRGTKARGVSRDENTLLSLKHQINDLKLQLRQANLEAEAANSRAGASEDARLCLLSESQSQIQKMSDQHQELLEALRRECETSRRLREALDEACEEGRRRDVLVMTNRQLESKRYFDRASQDKSLRILQAGHQREMREKDIELRQLTDLQAKVSQLQEEVTSLKAKEKSRLKNKQLQLESPPTSPTQPLSTRASSFAGTQLSIFSSRPGSALALTGSRRFLADREGSAIKSTEALMQKLRDSFAAQESASRKEEKEAGFEELSKEIDIADVSSHHKKAKSALKSMRATLDASGGAEGIADLDYAGLPLATAIFTKTDPKKKASSILVGQGDGSAAKGASWGNQGPTGLERSRSVTWRKQSAAEQLEQIKTRIDAGLSPNV